MLEFISNSEAWTGQKIGGVSHPRSIETKWSDAELAAIGLRKRVEPDPGTTPPSVEDVALERDRRLAMGFAYDFQDGRGVHQFATTVEDWKGWDKVDKLSNALQNVGNTTQTIDILTETGPAAITAVEWSQIIIAAGVWEQVIWQKSFVLQAMDPIPADYTDDSHWS